MLERTSKGVAMSQDSRTRHAKCICSKFDASVLLAGPPGCSSKPKRIATQSSMEAIPCTFYAFSLLVIRFNRTHAMVSKPARSGEMTL